MSVLQLIIIIIFLLEHSCFTILCQFWLDNRVNQLYEHIQPLSLEPPSHSAAHPTHLGHHRALS